MNKSTKNPSAKPVIQTTQPTAHLPKMRMVEMDVTPAQATKWLEKNEFNRNLSMTRVKDMVDDMMNGRWIGLSPEAIVIGMDGSLYDGQHRLHALIQAGMTIRLRVYLDAPPEVLNVLNKGKPRSAADIIAIADKRKVNHVVSAVIGAIYLLRSVGTLSAARVKMGPDSMRIMLLEHEQDVATVIAAIGGAHNHFSNAALLSALAVAYRTSPNEVQAFCGAIATGANLAPDSPVLALRDIITGVRSPKMAHSSGNTSRRDDLNLRAFSAIHAFVNGESRSFVKPNEAARKFFLRPWSTTETA